MFRSILIWKVQREFQEADSATGKDKGDEKENGNGDES